MDTLRGARVLVTGADGFIASHLVEQLVGQTAIVTALSCYNSFDNIGWLSELPEHVARQIVVIRGDVRDPAQVRKLVRDQDMVFHLAALIAIPHSYVAAHSYVETNVCGTLNMLEAAREFGIKRFVHTSTSEVYGTALTIPITEDHPLQGQSPYSASKIGADMMAEAYARSFGLPVVILRPFNTFGPRQSERAVIPTIIRQLLDPHCVVMKIGDTTTRRDLTYVSDTASAFVAAGLAKEIEFGRAYNAGNGKCIDMGTLIELIQETAGIRKPIEHDPARMRPTDSEVRVLVADSTKFASHTGWAARVSLRNGLKHTVDWWRKRIAAGLVRPDCGYMT